MTANEHLLVLFSIVLGLGLTELLSSFHNLVHPDTRTRWHWLPVYWAWSVFASIVFWWWIMFNFTVLDSPNFFGIILILMGPVLLYLMATSVLPDIAPGDTVDLGTYYIANRQRFFGFAAAYTAVLWLQSPVFGWEAPRGAHAWAAIAFLQLAAQTRTTNLRLHAALSVLNAVMFAGSVAAYWFRIV